MPRHIVAWLNHPTDRARAQRGIDHVALTGVWFRTKAAMGHAGSHADVPITQMARMGMFERYAILPLNGRMLARHPPVKNLIAQK